MDGKEFILAMASIIMGGTIVMTVIRTVAKAMMSRNDRGSLGVGGVAMLDERLGRMEQAIEAMAIEVERVSEGQRFTSKLLAERATTPDRLGQ